MNEVVLYDYWRSSASYRVRIALNLLGIDYQTVSINLLEGAHKTPEYLALNPQGLVPTLVIDGKTLTQSLAIIEYLAETWPECGLLPSDIADRQKVRALAYAVAMDIHPICNLHVVSHLMTHDRQDRCPRGMDEAFHYRRTGQTGSHDRQSRWRVQLWRCADDGGPLSCSPGLQRPPLGS